jgi:CBS domain-containing protein
LRHSDAQPVAGAGSLFFFPPRRLAMVNTLTSRLILCAETARELMTGNPLSMRADATIHDAIALLADKGISAAPVIDEAGQPIGVVSRTDILLHEREQFHRARAGTAHESAVQVQDIMTPAVFSIRQDAPAARVIEELVALNVNHLFVVDGGGALVGVITTRDVLSKLQPECV